jgi:hypothetical protein
MIKQGQKLHASLAFMKKKYCPQATFSVDKADMSWNKIIGIGEETTTDWIPYCLSDLLELDLFDHSAVPDILKRLDDRSSYNTKVELLGRLAFMARSGMCY